MKIKGFAFENFVTIEDKSWFFDFANNTICRFVNGEIELDIEYIEKEGKHTWGGLPEYGKMMAFGNKLILIPWIPSDIIIYDTKIRTIKRIAFTHTKYTGMYLCDACFFGDNLYIIPTTYSKILKLNMRSEHIDEIDLNEEEGTMLAFGSIAKHNGHILFGSLIGNILFDYDTINDTMTKCEVPEFSGGCGGFFDVNNHVYFIPARTDAIYEWGLDYSLRRIELAFPEDFVPGEISFHRIVVSDNLVFFLPRNASVGLQWDVNTNRMKSFSAYRVENPRYELNKLMPISYIWKGKSGIYACLSEQRKIVNIYTGEEVAYRARIIKHAPLEGLIKEDDNRLTSVDGFVERLAHGEK